MGLLLYFHAALDWLMACSKLIRNEQFGWKTWNRKTGAMEREQEPLLKKLKLLLFFNPLMEWIDTTHLVRLYAHDKTLKQGFEEAKKSTHYQIKPFIKKYGINMDEFEPDDPERYGSFEDFFVRHHKPGSRPIHEEDNSSFAVVVADSRVVVYDTITLAHKLWIKGHNFNMPELLMDTAAARRFNNGAIASFRLSPQDYHRYHSPVTGKVTDFRSIPGDYYQVDPVALHSNVDILTRNARCWVSIETEEFGHVVFVAIGATEVGTVQIHDQWQKAGGKIKKGDELGIFQFGGSSIIVAFQEGRIRFDEDLMAMSRQQIQTAVEVGMSLGKSLPKHKVKNV